MWFEELSTFPFGGNSVNEKLILERWDKLGLLEGLNDGELKKNVALEYENAAIDILYGDIEAVSDKINSLLKQYCLPGKHVYISSKSYSFYAFPLVRRVIVRVPNATYKEIKGILENITDNELSSFADSFFKERFIKDSNEMLNGKKIFCVDAEAEVTASLSNYIVRKLSD